MSIIPKLKQLFKHEYVEIIYFKCQGDGSEFLDHDMPFPLTMKHTNDGYKISWALDGYSGTNTGKEYKFDTIDRITKALNAEVLPYLPSINEHFNPQINQYKDFKGIDLPREEKKPKRDIKEHRGGDDELFDLVRFDIYELKARGLLYYERVFDIIETANQRLGFNKSLADIKSKARNMFEWTEKNYCPGISTEQIKQNRKRTNAKHYIKAKGKKNMTKAESAKVAYTTKIIKVKTKIEFAIDTLKEQKLKINKSRVAKMANVHRDTVAKYWTEFVY